MLIRTPEQDIERVLFTEKAIAARVEQLGADLTAKLGDKRPVLAVSYTHLTLPTIA